jgi:predicted ArsR family transcriptional regulator
MDLFGYPNSPGFKGRDTSADAAAEVAEKAPLLRARCLAVLERSNGLTADEVAGRLGASILSVRPRITELTRLNKVRDSGERRRNASGKRAIVWAAIQPARLNKPQLNGR